MRFLLVLAVAMALTISWQTATLAERNPDPDKTLTTVGQDTERMSHR